MTLEFLGVGSAFAKRHHQNNILINGNILVDCASSAGRSLHETGRSFLDIDHIFITHIHADHIGGLEECAFLNRYAYNSRKPRLYLSPELIDTLWEQSLRGGLEDPACGGCALTDYFDVVQVERRFEIASVQFEIIPTVHVQDKFCCGLKIDNRIYFSGDTRFDPKAIRRHGSDVEVIYHDCQLSKGGIHASLEELATLPEAIRSKIRLMHYSDDYHNYEQHARAAGFAWTRQHEVYAF